MCHMHRIIAALLLFVALPLSAQTLDADQLWAALMAGNQNFVAGTVAYPDLKQERGENAEKQNPPVTVLSCSDSHVPPELVFSQSLGALFVIREAGNIADTFGIAAMEFAVIHDYTKLLVILGHENCGAVIASLVPDDPRTPSLLALVTRIRGSFIGIPYSIEPANVRRAAEANVRASAAHVLANSAVIRDAVGKGKVKVVLAMYDVTTGAVRRLP
jgi:carbonic anhydrase